MGKKSKKSKKKSGKHSKELPEEPTPGSSREFDVSTDDETANQKNVVQPGELVYKGMPLAFAVINSFVDSVCNFCLADDPQLVCPNCRIMKYCTNECKFKDIYHSGTECRNILRQQFELPDFMTRYVAEVVVKYKRDPEKVNGEALLRHAITFDDLECCRHQVVGDKEKKVRKIFEDIEDYLHPSDMITFSEFVEVYGKAIEYASKVYVPNSYRSKAIGLYLGPWLLQHSCGANTVATWNERRIQYYVSEPIPGRNLELVTANHLGYTSKTRLSRLVRMGRLCMSTCQCKRCDIFNEDQIFCEQQVPTSNPLVKKIDFARGVLKRMPKKTVEDVANVMKVATRAWEDMDDNFGKFHRLRAKITRYMCFASFYLEKYRDSRYYCMKLLDFCEAYYGHNHPRTTLTLVILSYLEAMLNREEQSKKNFLTALERAKICFGQYHPYYYGLSKDCTRILAAGGWNADVIQVVEHENMYFRKDRFEL